MLFRSLPLIDAFERQLPKARLALVEGLSSHVAEWISTGRLDLGLVHNPDSQPGLEIQPLLEERLCLVQRASETGGGGLPFRELAAHPLVVPERQHVIRRQLDTQATLTGVALQVRWEVSSIAAIIDLVAAGKGRAVLTASAVVASGRGDELVVRPIEQPALHSVLCLASSAHKRATPLMRQAARVIGELVRALPQGTAARSLPG